MTLRPGSENPYDTLQLHLFGAFAEFERAIIRERQREGIAQAKARGVYTGRKPALTPEHFAGAKERRATGVPLARIARDLGVARTTLQTALAGVGTYAESSSQG